jgi:acylphosphatase
VRNLTDGSVEAFAVGNEEAVGSFTAACHAGPPAARVSDVRTISREADPAPLSGFQQLPTASST